ncbi:MAG: Mrp/NBP35 family ATP-binding protein, partial [Muribaculaceae bacterium]|nr:Mrp/NBP35 family ATP-binding protein [Muribaculaceae bacterium]
MAENPLYPARITDALRTVRYPGKGQDIVSLDMVEDDIRIDGRKVSFSLIFDKTTDPFARSLAKAAEAAIHAHVADDVEVTVNIKARPAPVAEKPSPLPGARNIIGISSGKGGVGKSTVAANLAVSLAAEGYKVGLLDADIFGPSVPKMFGIEDEELYMHEVDGRNLIIPIEKYGVKLLSIGLMVEKDSAVVWRGSMASNALKQLIEHADWGELDYFLIDMPPGTSDIHLTLVQTLGITGALVVTTPQRVALADARKGIAMFRDPKINVPVLGLVDNMAWFTPEQHPDERYYIFGNDEAVKETARDFDVPVLAEIPLVASVGEHSDNGSPVALTGSVSAQYFVHLSRMLVDAVDRRNRELPPTQHVRVH